MKTLFLTVVLLFSLLIVVEFAFAQGETGERVLAKSLVAESDEKKREEMLVSHPEFVNAKLATAIREEGDRLNGKLPRPVILNIYLLGVRIAEKVEDQAEVARSLIGVGNAHDNPQDQLAAYARGLTISTGLNDDPLSARLLYNISRVHFARDPEKAREFAGRSLKLSQKIGNKLLQASALGLIGNTHALQGDAFTAIEFGKKALAIREEVGDKDAISVSLSNLGIAYHIVEDYEKALDSFLRCVAMMESIGLGKETAVDLYNIGNVYLAMGDYLNAMHFYQKSSGVRRENRDSSNGADLAINFAMAYKEQGEYARALTYLESALAAFDNGTEEYGLADTLDSLGEVHAKMDSLQKAIDYLHRASLINERMKRATALANSLRRLGDAYTRLDDIPRARAAYDRALNALSPHNKRERADVMLSIATLQLKQKEHLLAAETAKQAVDLLEPRSGRAFEVAGEVARATGKEAEAIQYFTKSVELTERGRERTFGGPEASWSFFTDRLSSYHSLIKIFVARGDLESAWRIAERSKARSMLDILQSGKRNITREMSATEIDEEQTLRTKLASLNKRLLAEQESKDPSLPRINELRSAVDQARFAFEDFQSRIYARLPNLKAERGNVEPLPVSAAASLLPDSQSILAEYVVSKEAVYVFLIGMDDPGVPKISSFVIDVKAEHLAQRVKSFRASLSSGDLAIQNDSRALFDLLVKPAAARLSGKKNLIIVPDGPLWDLPFQALVDSSGKFLVEKLAVSYAPSITALREMQKKARKRNRTTGVDLVAFGNPVLGKQAAERLGRVFMDKLEPIPEAERLVNKLGTMYGTTRAKVFTGSNAREEIAKAEAPKYRIVQFATHGVLNNSSPMYSHLVLAQNEKNPNEDGLLEAWELKDLDLKADILILSACDTARGKISGGEGMIGMTWAAFIAGAPTTVASQWKVESSSTTEFMLEFHRQMLGNKKISKAEALRRASLKLMKSAKYRHPSYWAPWVLVGDGS